MGRAPCCDKEAKVKKGPWTPDEDLKLVAYIQQHGHGSWRALPEKAGLARCGKSCRLRWTNYLRPDIKRGRFSHEEEQTIFQLHAILGNRWSAIASRLPRRTDNEIKNYWNTHLKKRLAQVGIGPFSSSFSSFSSSFSSSKPSSLDDLQELLTSSWTPLVPRCLSHMTQWDLTLAEAQARLRPKPRDAATEQAHPSAFFMRSWKTEVEHTLRPKFGTVNLGPRGTVVVGAQSWGAGTVPTEEGLRSGSVLGGSCVGAVPMTEDSLSGSVLDDSNPLLLGLETMLGGDVGEEDSGEARSGLCSGSVLGDQISPTSVLHGPECCDYADVPSPCGSTNSGTTTSAEESFDFTILHQSDGCMSPTADTFWEPSESGLESIIPLDFEEAEFPQLESLGPEGSGPYRAE